MVLRGDPDKASHHWKWHFGITINPELKATRAESAAGPPMLLGPTWWCPEKPAPRSFVETGQGKGPPWVPAVWCFLWFPMGHFGLQISPGRELKGMYRQCDSEQDPEKKNLVPQFLYFQLEDNNSAVAMRMSWYRGENESEVHRTGPPWFSIQKLGTYGLNVEATR